MKRIIALLICGLMAASLFGCSSSNLKQEETAPGDLKYYVNPDWTKNDYSENALYIPQKLYAQYQLPDEPVKGMISIAAYDGVKLAELGESFAFFVAGDIATYMITNVGGDPSTLKETTFKGVPAYEFTGDFKDIESFGESVNEAVFPNAGAQGYYINAGDYYYFIAFSSMDLKNEDMVKLWKDFQDKITLPKKAS